MRSFREMLQYDHVVLRMASPGRANVYHIIQRHHLHRFMVQIMATTTTLIIPLNKHQLYHRVKQQNPRRRHRQPCRVLRRIQRRRVVMRRRRRVRIIISRTLPIWPIIYKTTFKKTCIAYVVSTWRMDGTRAQPPVR